MKSRINVHVSDLNVAKLHALAMRRGRTLTDLVDAALTDYFADASRDERDAAIVRRLDRLTRQFDRLEQKDTVLGETLALFIRYYLMVTPPLPASQIDAARAEGEKQFNLFIEQLGRDLQSGKRILQRAVDEALAEENEFFTEEELDRLHDPVEPASGDASLSEEAPHA